MGRQKHQNKVTPPVGLENPLEIAVQTRDRATLDMVKDAIKHKQVRLAFQPIVNAHDHSFPAFYEGLIRVLDETGRIIPAKDFMGAVADTETGRQLDCLALELGLQTLANYPQVRLSLNMSARSIGYSKWSAALRRGLKRKPEIGERLILEISEASALQVPELVRDFMNDLQPLGISFALDDFGAGLTSYMHFKDFYFDIIKLDGQFSRNLPNDRENQILASAIASIAREFDIYTVACRVETPQEAEILRSLGFDCLQGFLFGAPAVSPPWVAKSKSVTAA